MAATDRDPVPTGILERGDVVRIQRSWRLDVDVTVAVVVAVRDEGPIVDGPAIERPTPARAGLVLNVLGEDTILGQDQKGAVHTLDQDRAVVTLYCDGESEREIDVPNSQIQAYLQNVAHERGWSTLLPSYRDLLEGGEQR